MVQSDDDVEANYSKMQLTTLEWGYLLSIAGGCQEPYKSAWYPVDYEWKRRKWKCMNPGQDKVMKATYKAGEISPLRYLHAREAISMLVMYLTPDGNNKYQVKYMNKNATDWETSIRSGSV